MKDFFKWLGAANLTVALIVALSVSLSWEDAPAANTNLLSDDLSAPQNAEDVNLRFENGKNAEDLEFSSYSEVYHFDLVADAPYSLRYVTFDLEFVGLKGDYLSAPRNWNLYEVTDGEVDFAHSIGTGESFKNGQLHVRLSTPWNQVYHGLKGRTSFALVTSVIRDNDSDESVYLRADLPESDLAKDMDWGWTHGHHEGSWLSVPNAYGLEKVN